MTAQDTPWWARTATVTKRRRVRFPALLTAAAVTGIFFTTLAPSGTPVTADYDFNGALRTYQTQAALIAQCGPTYTSPERSTMNRVALDRPDQNIPLWAGTIVPVMGPMSATPAPDEPRFYPRTAKKTPSAPSLLRSMWDGRMVVYYDEEAPDRDVEALEVISGRDDLDVVVVPWRQPEALPVGRHIAFSVFWTSQSCFRLAPRALEDFRTANPASQAPGADGTPPLSQP